MNRLRRLLRDLFRSDQEDVALAEEIDFHLDMETRDLVAEGMDPQEAHRQARLRFGGVDRFSEQTREVRMGRWFEALIRDVRFAVRTLVARPGFTLVAVLTIAIGIGANSAIFSVVHGVLIAPIPVEEPSELVVPDVIAPTGFSISLSIPNARDWRDRNRTFESFAATMGAGRTLTGGDRPEIIRTQLVLADFFETLGVEAAHGRVIRADETFEGAEPVAVITYGFWQRHFGGAPALGETLTLDDEPFTIIGIMPQEFVFPDPSSEIYLPMGFYESRVCWSNRDCSQGSFGIGRLADGVTLATAQQDLDRIVREIEAEEGEEVARPVLEPLVDSFVGDIRRNLWVAMGAVGFVLLIACANVASLLLARGEARRREIALRSALGAARGRIVRQFLTESMVLAGVGGLIGVGLAFLGIRLLVPLISDAIPSMMASRIGMNLPVLLFTMVATACAGVIFGLAPVTRISATELTDALKDGGRGGPSLSRSRLRSVLVVTEVALSVILLVGAGLMIQSLQHLRTVDKGFQEDGLLTARVSLPRSRYPDQSTSWAFFRELHQRVAALPGVERASLTQILPLGGNSWELRVYPEGMPVTPENESSVLYYMVTPEHFELFDIPLVAGRGFGTQDRNGGVDVAIIDESMAERFWPGEDAVGKRLTLQERTDTTGVGGEPQLVYRTVVGVVKNVRHYELENPARITVYVPFENTRRSWSGSLTLAVSTPGDPSTLAEPIRSELAALDPQLPLSQVRTMEGVVDAAMSAPRSLGTLLTVFGLVAVILSAIGLFGLMSFTVAQRFRDIGIRMALGASARRVIANISGRGVGLAAAGVVLGLLGAIGLGRVMAGLLFEVNPLDAWTFLMVSAFLLGVAALAAWIPALRATRVDPAVVLREE